MYTKLSIIMVPLTQDHKRILKYKHFIGSGRVLTRDFVRCNKEANEGYHKEAKPKTTNNNNKNRVTNNNIGVGCHVASIATLLLNRLQKRCLLYVNHYAISWTVAKQLVADVNRSQLKHDWKQETYSKSQETSIL